MTDNQTEGKLSSKVRGSGDIDLAEAVGRAIRAAMGDMTQPELAARTGIDQPTISKLVRGTLRDRSKPARPSPLTLWEMREIEKATGVPPGFILTHMRYLPRNYNTPRQAIMADASLTREARSMLLATLDAASPDHEATPASGVFNDHG
jgi:transcriptional regulator with XRE-family HTH domain